MNATVTENHNSQSVPRRQPVVAQGNQFAHAFKSELRKVLTLRSSIIWVVLMTGSLYGFVVLQGLFTTEKASLDWNGLTTGTLVFMLLAIVYGAGATAGELGNHMQAHSFLTQKARWHWLSARLIITVMFVIVNYAVGLLVSLLVAVIMPKLEFNGGDMKFAWVPAIYLAGYALVAAGVAMITRSRVAGLALPLVWFLVIENLLFAVGSTYEIAKKLYEFSPGHAMQDLSMEAYSAEAPVFTVAHNVTVLAVWVAVAVAAALFFNSKRDVR